MTRGSEKNHETRGAKTTRGKFREIAIGSLAESPLNPRKRYEKDKINELAESISSVGIIEPLVVRVNGSPDSRDQDSRGMRSAPSVWGRPRASRCSQYTPIRTGDGGISVTIQRRSRGDPGRGQRSRVGRTAVFSQG